MAANAPPTTSSSPPTSAVMVTGVLVESRMSSASGTDTAVPVPTPTRAILAVRPGGQHNLTEESRWHSTG